MTKPKKYTVRDVVKHEMKNEIDKVIKKDPRYGGEDHKKWLSLYQSAVTQVVNDLMQEEKEEFEDMAEEWSSQQPPREVQAQ